jgi:hypothetical protein
MSSFQYRAHCKRCLVNREISRAQIMSGRNPACDHCGEDMVVYSGTGETKSTETAEQRMRAVEGS